MDRIKEILETAANNNQVALTEPEALELLSLAGLPVIEHRLTKNPDEAANEASSIGFPVVVKGVGRNLLHKTEKGAVKLDLRSKEEVLRACEEIQKSAGKDVEAFIVEKFVASQREFVAGLVRDAQFGPAVMFGLGGIFTETLHEVAFRIAPLSEYDARTLLYETRAGNLLGTLRGLPPVNTQVLINMLIEIGNLGLNYEQIAEIDLNPIRIDTDGNPIVVDALIALKRQT